MKIAFFGLPLGALLLADDGHEIAVATLAPVGAPGRRRLERRLGSGQVLDDAELGAGLESAVEAHLAVAGADLVVSWFWTRKLPERWLAAARLGGVGVHPSLLPRHRGPNPFFWTIDSGDERSGVSVHRLTPEYDDGAVLEQLVITVGERDSWQLARALDRPSLCALRRVVRALAEGRPPAERAQDPAAASFAPEPDGDALRVDWRWPVARVLRRIRALSPVPGLALEIHGVPFFVTRASAAPSPAALAPGEAAVLGEPPERVVVRAADGGVGLDAAAIPEAPAESELREVDGAGLAAVIARRRMTVLD
jgi:methionyl-tRNA formyltransferase